MVRKVTRFKSVEYFLITTVYKTHLKSLYDIKHSVVTSQHYYWELICEPIINKAKFVTQHLTFSWTGLLIVIVRSSHILKLRHGYNENELILQQDGVSPHLYHWNGPQSGQIKSVEIIYSNRLLINVGTLNLKCFRITITILNKNLKNYIELTPPLIKIDKLPEVLKTSAEKNTENLTIHT